MPLYPNIYVCIKPEKRPIKLWGASETKVVVKATTQQGNKMATKRQQDANVSSISSAHGKQKMYHESEKLDWNTNWKVRRSLPNPCFIKHKLRESVLIVCVKQEWI